MFRSRFLMAAFVAAIAALAGPATSQATFTLTLPDATTVNDGGTNHILYSNDTFSVGTETYSIFVRANTTDFSPSVYIQGITDLSISVQHVGGTSGPHVVTLGLNWNGIMSPTDQGFGIWFNTGMQAGTVSFGSVALHSEATGSSSSFAQTDLLVSGNFNSATGKDSLIVPFVPGNDTPYTITQGFTITLPGDDVFNISAHGAISAFPGGNLEIVPAPAGLILAATGLPFLGLLRRRMRRTDTTVAA
jgi:hypothetical protein